ncbi:MAG TPA: hypothetical protein VD973_09415 [Symbiobacteriaceae bacterium]|nr:hypothetical protein [Symbiobacteriaceae bacterium]
MSTALDRLRADLGSHRAELMAEKKQLTAQLEEIERALQGIDQVLGSGGQKPKSAGTGDWSTANAERDLLRKRMIEILIGETGGLTSYELLTRIQPDWAGSELSVRRIGSNAANMAELTGDGERWYYVPADKSLENDLLP